MEPLVVVALSIVPRQDRLGAPGQIDDAERITDDCHAAFDAPERFDSLE